MNPERCKFQPSGFYANIETYHCNQEIFKNGICIFHIPKKDQTAKVFNASDTELDNEFANALEKYIEKNKLNDLDFSFFSFSSGSDLSYSFDQTVDFMGAFFCSKPKFQEAQFLRKVDFTNAKFLGDVDFFKVGFSEHVLFLGARFTGNVNFSFANFKNGARFGSAIPWDAENEISHTFEKDVIFSRATFGGDIEFLGDDSLNWKVNFQEDSRGAKFRKDTLFGAALTFHAVRTLPGVRVTFNSVDLSRASFQLTDVTSFEFKSVM